MMATFKQFAQFLQKKWLGVVLLGLLVIGLGIRIYQVESLPPGLTWDEAAIGYNGFAVFETYRDEWLFRLPISFRSFGDYKAPLAIYANGIFTAILGLNIFAIRLPFVIAGTLSIGAIYWLAREWWLELGQDRPSTHLKKEQPFLNQSGFLWVATLGSALLLTFSPWHLHFSRAGFEVGIALFLVMIGLASWLRSHTEKSWWWLLVSAVSLALSLYSYHSSKVVVPLLLVGLVIGQWRSWLKRWRQLLFFAVIFGIVSLPLAYDSLLGQGAERLTQTTVFSQSSSGTELVGLVIGNFCQHFDPDFLVLGQVADARQGLSGWGVLNPLIFCLLVFFVLKLIFTFGRLAISGVRAKKIPRVDLISWARQNYLKERSLPLLLIVAGVFPAALGVDVVPHTIRSLLSLPGFILLSVSILLEISDRLQLSRANQVICGSQGEKNVIIKSFLGMFLLIYLILSTAFLGSYFKNFSQEASDDFAAGTLEAMTIARAYEIGQDFPEKEKIVFTNAYGQPYIYALMVGELTPYQYHGGALIKYEFKEVEMGDLMRPNALVVAARDELPDVPLERFQEVVYGSDGQVRFKIFVTNQP